MAREEMPNVIVLVPGILGSVLQKNNRDVWAASGGAALAALLSGAGSLRESSIHKHSLEDDLGDGVVATRLMPNVHIIPSLWKIDGYSKIGETIKAVFDVGEGSQPGLTAS